MVLVFQLLISQVSTGSNLLHLTTDSSDFQNQSIKYSFIDKKDNPPDTKSKRILQMS